MGIEDKMKRLDQDFNYRDFSYHQEWRNETFAIYSQWSDGELVGYESIKIKKYKAGERFGKYFEASESFPSDKEWGANGFTSKTLIEAQNCLLKHFPDIPFNFTNLLSPTAIETHSLPGGMVNE